MKRKSKNLERVSVLVLWATLLTFSNAFAIGHVVKCGCYCGISIDPPCSDDDCKRACGSPGTTSSQVQVPAAPVQAQTDIKTKLYTSM